MTAIDDATGKIVARFAQRETTIDLMKLMWQYMEKYGRPHIVYSDHGGPYKVNVGNQDGHKETQLGRALTELGIKLIHANSPQAKGRIERNHETNQDRLIKEMRLRNICTINAANQYLQEVYIPEFNSLFVVEPAKPNDAHCSIKQFNFNQILSIQEKRVIQNDGVIQHEKSLFQITVNRSYAKAKSVVTVRTHLDGTITLWSGTIQLDYVLIQTKPLIQRQQSILKHNTVRSPTSPASKAWNDGNNRFYKFPPIHNHEKRE